MKRFLLILILFLHHLIQAQTFWTENFNNGCNSGCLANGSNTGNGAWSVVSLAGDANPLVGDLPNQWYVSCAENGHTTGVCGSGCVALSAVNTLASLHMGSTSSGDIGAAYDAGGLCGLLWCTNTHKQVISPLISTIGQTNITLSFTYIEFGQGTTDDMYAVQYSTNGGTTWTTLSNPAKTPCCGGACNGFRQGQWTTYTSATLPVAAENISNFKISFIWKNNDDGLGTDPSFAVDNITLSTPVVLPIELTDFNAEKAGKNIQLKWSTSTELNFNEFIIERSEDGIGYYKTGIVKGTGNSNSVKHYTFVDNDLKNALYYYRLKLVDDDGSYNYSPIRAINFSDENSVSSAFFDSNSSEIIIPGSALKTEQVFNTELISTNGVTVNTGTFHLIEIQNNELHIPVRNVADGLYILRLSDNEGTQSFRVMVAH
jgi:hypothetical protein